ncbi:MAG TPA: hypothetical protein VK459_16630 [Polyangiaceae bacterium]|nr:hypothetical protein [Polyangiaceae bacterium]
MGFTLHGIGLYRVLALPALRLTGIVAALVLALGLFAGAVRVLPILLASTLPLRLAAPLARGALGMALETALFVAPPLAWALAASALIERGEARALSAMGVRPARIVASAWPAALVVAMAAGLAGLSWGREAVAPGRLVRDLVAGARSACAEASAAGASGKSAANAAPIAVDVPSLGFSWVCFPGAEPRILGPAPFGAVHAVVLSASAIDLSDDLRAIRLLDATLSMPPSAPSPLASARLRASEVAITGLAPLGRASNIGVLARALLLSVSAASIAALAAGIVLTRNIRSRPRALAVGLAGPAAALMVFSSLERAPAPPFAYVTVPIAGLFALIALVSGASALSSSLRGSREGGTG